MDEQASSPQPRHINYTALRCILIALIIGLSIFKLFISYKGLDQEHSMDQAQIARQVSLGKGFTTQFLRPMELKTAVSLHEQSAGESGAPFDINQFRDTNHAPLNICAMAVALKLTGYDQFEATRIPAGESSVYGGDRVISGLSLLFFIGALVLAYTLITRIFDEAVAASTVAFLTLSDLMLQYSVSGLPQPLMMCCMLGAMHFMLSAIRANHEGKGRKLLTHLMLAFLCITLLCLTSWMAIWVALGLLVFCAFYFRPFGAYAVPGFIILLLGLLFPLLANAAHSGSFLGNAYYALYNCFGSGEDLVQRSTAASNLPLNNSSFILRLVGYTFTQVNGMYAAMGAIIVTPFFFLTLLNRYKTARAEGIKWATFCMWGFSCIGMALYGVTSTYGATQLNPLFAPIFAAYGIALVFNFLARLKLGTSFNMARGLTIFAMLMVSAGAFIFNLPGEIHRGIWLGSRSQNTFPPYYAPALNAKGDDAGTLADLSNEQDVIVTDQPWAVAWYANRKALWIPMRMQDYVDDLEPILTKTGSKVQGFLITPTSHSPNRDVISARPGGLNGLAAQYGDFAPLAMEGSLLRIVPSRNLLLTELYKTNDDRTQHTLPIASLFGVHGKFAQRHFLLGHNIVYYSAPGAQAR